MPLTSTSDPAGVRTTEEGIVPLTDDAEFIETLNEAHKYLDFAEAAVEYDMSEAEGILDDLVPIVQRLRRMVSANQDCG